MPKNLSQKKLKKAFSLIELSIVILIISILIVGSMSASITAMNNAKYKVTRDRMAEIYKAMGNYLLTNKALPCPASLVDLKSSSPNYGISGTAAGACNGGAGVYVGGASSQLAYGMVPVQTLGLNTDMGEDGFGNRFTYIVAKAFTQPSVTIDDTTGFGRAPETGMITVKESLGSSVFQLNTNDAIFVIISHGANKFGAFNSNSATQNAASLDADEIANYGSSFGSGSVTLNSYFVSSSVNSDLFDDVLLYKTRNTMVLDFNAMSLVVCKEILSTTLSTDTNNYYSITGIGSSFTWPQTYYNQVASSTTTCSSANPAYISTVTNPTKRCGAFGVWQAGVISPCTN